MFALRGIAVSLSVFVIVYCALSLSVSLGWRAISPRVRRLYPSIRRIADWLFALRMLPLFVAALITAAFAVPSFLLLEPRAIEEPVGEIPVALACCAAALTIFGLVNAGIAVRRASRTIFKWTRAAQPMESRISVPVLRIARSVPAMTVTGVIRPRVLLSGAAEGMLTAKELQIALNHEVAHVRRRDNLRKLLVRFVAFPGMAGLEAAWLETTEMAADDAAVSNSSEALDLAAALIKLATLGPIQGPVDLTAALVHSPASIMNARVERLIAWSEERRVVPRKYSPWYGLGAGLAAVAAFAVTYSQLLVHIHTATEWLVQ